MNWLLLLAIPTTAFALLVSVPPPLALDQLDQGSLEQVLLTTGRLLSLGLTGWLIITQFLYTLGVLTRANWLVTVLRPVTLPIVRRIAAGAATVTISLGGVTAMAQTTPEPVTVTVDDDGTTTLRQEATPTPNLQPLVEPEDIAECSGDEPAGSYTAPLTWHARPGDNLWRIAGEHLAIVLNRPPTRDEHRNYWVDVIEAARPVIRSGDPNLIYPGEHIPLPPLLDAGITP